MAARAAASRSRPTSPDAPPAPDGDVALLRHAVEEAARLLDADGAMVYLLDEEAGRLRFAVDAGIRNPEARALIRDLSLPVGVGIFGSAIERREVMVTDDYRRDKRFSHSPVADRIVAIANMYSMAAAPLIAEGEVLGALGAYTARIGDLDEAKVGLLKALADHAATEIANRRLIERLAGSRRELARRVDAQRTLGRIAARIAVIREPGEVLQSVAEAARKLIGSDGAHLTLLDHDRRVLRPTAVAGGGDEATRLWLATQEFPLDGGLNGLAATRGELVWTEDYRVEPRVPHEPDDEATAERMGLRGMAVAPMRGPEGAVIGTLAVSFEEPHRFTDDEGELIQGLADQGAIAITNARLTDDLRQSQERYRFLVDQSVDIMWTIDTEARFTYLSDSLERLTGFRPDELIGKHVSAATAPESMADVENAFVELTKNPERVYKLRILEPRKDGSLLPVEIRGTGIVDPDGRLLGAHGTNRDITEVVRLENYLRAQAEELRRRVDAQRALAEIAAQITSLRDPSAVLGRTIAETKRLLNADHVIIHQLEGGSDLLVDYRATRGDHAVGAPIDDTMVRIGQGVAGRAVEEGRVVWTGDYLKDPAFTHTPGADEWIEKQGQRSQISAPLPSETGPLGAISAYASAPDAFDDVAAEVLGALASHAAIVLVNARLYAELEHRVEAQRTLGGIAARITAIREPGDVLQETLDEAVRLLNADGGRIELMDEGGGLRWAFGHTAIDLPIEHEARAERIQPSGVSALAVGERRVVITGDYLEDDSFKHAEASDRYIREHGIRSVISAPLIGEDGAIGSLTVHAQERDAFGPDAAELLELLAAHGAIAVTNARLYERLHARIDAQRTLAEISAEIAALREPAAVIQRTVNEAVRLLGADRAQINPLEPGSDLLGLPLAVAPSDARADDVQVPVGTGISGTALARGRIVSTGDYLKDRSFRHTRAGDASIRSYGLRSLMAAPLIGSSGPIGVLTVQSTRPGAFDEGDAELLGHLADQAAIAVTNTRLYQELTERMEAQRALAEIAAQIAALRDPQDVLQRSVDEAVRLLGADCALLNPFDAEAGVLELAVAASPPDARLDDVVVPLGKGVSGRAIAERRVVRTGDYRHDRAFEHATPIDAYIERREMVSVMTAPLVGGEGPIGALTVQSARRHAFDDSDAVLLGLLADQAAIAISNARLYDELQRSERRYRFLVDNSPDIVWSVDAEGRFTFLSESLEGRTGWKPEQLLGQPFSVLTDDATRAAADAAWERVRANPDHEQRVRLDLPLRDGSVSASEVAMTGSVVDGRFAGAHGSVRDISERERLEGDLRVQAAELATSEERARLARELHDSATQALFSMGLTMRSLELLLETDPAAGRAKLTELRELQKDALAEMRTLIFELRPASLETDGLVQALRNHAAAVRARTGLEVSVDADLPDRPPLPVEEALYRIGQEALHNVVKHANAERAVIRVSSGRDGLHMSITDDGMGFDPDDVPRGHLGLVGMRQRAELAGAVLSIDSERGSGTRVEIHVPPAAARGQDASAVEETASAE